MTNSEQDRMERIEELQTDADNQTKAVIARMLQSRPEPEGKIASDKRRRAAFGLMEQRDSSATSTERGGKATDERKEGNGGVEDAPKTQSPEEDRYYRDDPMTTYPKGMKAPTSLVQRSKRDRHYAENQHGLGNASRGLFGGDKKRGSPPRELFILQEQQRTSNIQSTGMMGNTGSQLSPQEEYQLLKKQRLSALANGPLPASGMVGDTRSRLSPQEELQLLKRQRATALANGPLPASGVMGENSFLPSHNGYADLGPFHGSVSVPSRAWGPSNASLLYDQHLLVEQGPLREQAQYGGPLPYGDDGRDLNMLPPHLGQHLPSYGQRVSSMVPVADVPMSGMGMSDMARVPSQARGIDTMVPYYAGSMHQGQAGYPDEYAVGTEHPYVVDPLCSDTYMALRYPMTAAAAGMDRSSADLALERAKIRREVMLDQGHQMMEQGRLLLYESRQIPIRAPNLNALTLYTKSDEDTLSQYQCVVRKQIELFAAEQIDVETNAQGRNKPIVLNQVGIRCLHCASVHPKHRARGGTYYPSKLSGFYQAAQNMASSHLCQHCTHVPQPLRRQLLILRERKSSAGGGKEYWADAVRALGVIEDKENGILRFEEEKEGAGNPENGILRFKEKKEEEGDFENGVIRFKDKKGEEGDFENSTPRFKDKKGEEGDFETVVDSPAPKAAET